MSHSLTLRSSRVGKNLRTEEKPCGGVCVAHTYHHLAPSTPGKDIMTQDVQCALVTDAAADQVHLSKVVIVA